MKKLISLVIAVALVVCLLPVMASAEDPATNLYLDMTTYTGFAGDSCEPWAFLNEGGFTAEVQWTTSDPAVATVNPWGPNNAYGSISLVGAGTATITASYGGEQATCTVTVNAVEQLVLDTAKEVTLADYSGTRFQFTAPADGTYTIYAPASNGSMYGYVEAPMNWGEFRSDADEIYSVAVMTLTAGEVCTIYVSAQQEAAVTIQVKVINTPAATGYSFNEEVIEVDYPAGYETYTYAQLKADPVLAGMPQNLLYKIKDESIATIPYVSMDGSCVILPAKAGETVLEAYDGTELIASVPVVVTDITESIDDLVWGVEYDLSGDDNNYFYYTPSADDTFTFQSFGDTENSDPWVDILQYDGEYWNTVQDGYFDDAVMGEEFNFLGELALTKDTKYLIVVGNYQEGEYSFSVKGTAASDPGYDLKKVAAKPADCTTDGNIEYYECQKTGIKFANETATKLAGEVVIKATGHKLDKVAAVAATSEKEGNIAHEKCSVCGALVLEGKEVKAADVTVAKLDNPATGDSTMLLPLIALVVLSALGLGITAIARKRA